MVVTGWNARASSGNPFSSLVVSAMVSPVEQSKVLAFRRSPGQGRPVVFVHGNSSSSRTWHHILDGPFGQRYRCLAPDLPGHGASAPAPGPSDYSVPGHAAALAAFATELGAEDAVLVGWSLGGHIALQAAALLPAAPGIAVFGTPPIGSAADVAEGFLPNPAMGAGFTADIGEAEAQAYAAASLGPASAVPPADLVPDILATDGAARAGLGASLAEGRFADEVRIVGSLDRPLAVLHGAGEQLVNLDYLRRLAIPSLWRGAVQVVPGAGHALQEEAPQALADLLELFFADLPFAAA